MQKPINKILITGASSGVGQSLALHLGGRFHVVALARRAEKMRQDLSSIPSLSCYEIDLADEKKLDSEFNRILEIEGDISYIINNAGIMIQKPLDEISDSEFQNSLALNALAPFRLIRKVLPQMRKRNFGRIINITSGAPLACFPKTAAYCASKAALNAMTVAVAKENLDYNIKINLMSPGPVRSEMAPAAVLLPEICHPTADYLLNLDDKGPSGKFFWLGYEVPLTPDLEGVDWLKGVPAKTMRKVL